MQQNMIANKWVGIASFIFAIACLCIISSGVTLKLYNDDGFYLSVFEAGDTLKFLFKQYHEWSGRVAIDLLMISTIGKCYFWMIGIPLSIALTCFSCCRISGYKPKVTIFSFCVILFLSIPSEINNDASFWVTGFYNYLLPTSIALYVFSVIVSNSTAIVERVACVLFSIYFPYMEQASLCFIVSLIMLFIFKKGAINRFNLFIMALVLVNFIICIISPGSANRAYVESWNWFPQYQNYGYELKFFLGLDKLNELVFLKKNIPFILMTVSIALYRSSLGGMNLQAKSSITFLFAHTIISILRMCSDQVNNIKIFQLGILSGENFYEPLKYYSYLYMLIILSSCIYLMLDLALNDSSIFLPITALVVGMMSVTVLGFSPTVFASSFRVDYIFEIMCIIIIVFFVNKYHNRKGNDALVINL